MLMHLVAIDVPVSVGGMVVHPGDLIHADKHGAQVIPHDIAAQIPEAVAKFRQMRRVLLRRASHRILRLKN